MLNVLFAISDGAFLVGLGCFCYATFHAFNLSKRFCLPFFTRIKVRKSEDEARKEKKIGNGRAVAVAFFLSGGFFILSAVAYFTWV